MKLLSNFTNYQGRVFTIINTTDYNQDNIYSVQVAELDFSKDDELLGVDVGEKYPLLNGATKEGTIITMNVNEILFIDQGTYVIRVK